MSRHNKSATHLKSIAFGDKDPKSNPSSFIDCGMDIKQEIKVEETLEEDPLFIPMEAEEHIDNTETFNYENIDFPVFGHVQIEEVKLETNEENQVDKDLEQSDVHEEELNKRENIKDEHNDEDGDNVSNQDVNGGEGNNVDENIEENIEQVEQANNVVLENLTHEEALAFFSQ